MKPWSILVVGGAALTISSAALAQAAHPVADKLAEKVVAKYQNSSCEQLAQAHQTKTPAKTQAEQRAAEMLRQDPQLRAAFLNKVAAPIADKMVVCGFIP